jgi:hypothetical protein
MIYYFIIMTSIIDRDTRIGFRYFREKQKFQSLLVNHESKSRMILVILISTSFFFWMMIHERYYFVIVAENVECRM